MGKKNKNNYNHKRKKKYSNGSNGSSNSNSATSPRAAEASPSESSISTLSQKFGNVAVGVVDDIPNPSNESMKSVRPPLEPGRIAMICNLMVGRTELNGQYVKIQRILSNGRVSVEYTDLQRTDLEHEHKETMSIKADNLVVQWKEPEEDEEAEVCPICMETAMVSNGGQSAATAGVFSCCGMEMCTKCWVEIQQGQTSDRCPFCNADISDISQAVIVANNRARAERGDLKAIKFLASTYDFGGMGLSQNKAMARMWYRKAAKEDAKSANRLAELYLRGEGGATNCKEGYRWLQIASDMGNTRATTSLGVLYLTGGSGLPKNIVKGKKLLQKSIHKGDERAILVSKELF